MIYKDQQIVVVILSFSLKWEIWPNMFIGLCKYFYKLYNWRLVLRLLISTRSYFGKWKLSLKQKYKLIWQVCNCKIKPHFNWLFADIIVLRIWLSCESNFDKKLMKRRNYQQLNHCNSHVHLQLLPDDVLLSVRHVQKWFIVTVLNLVVGWLNQLLNWAVLAFTN